MHPVVTRGRAWRGKSATSPHVRDRRRAPPSGTARAWWRATSSAVLAPVGNDHRDRREQSSERRHDRGRRRRPQPDETPCQQDEHQARAHQGEVPPASSAQPLALRSSYLAGRDAVMPSHRLHCPTQAALQPAMRLRSTGTHRQTNLCVSASRRSDAPVDGRDCGMIGRLLPAVQPSNRFSGPAWHRLLSKA